MKKKNLNMSQIMNAIVAILIVIWILNLITNYTLLHMMTNDSREEVESMVNYSAEEAETLLGKVNSGLAEEILTKSDVSVVSSSENTWELYQAKRNIMEDLNNIQAEYGKEFKIFFYHPDSNTIIRGERGNMNVTQYGSVTNSMRNHLLELNQDNSREDGNDTWNITEINGKYYIFNYKYYLGAYICSYLSVQDFINLFARVRSEANSYIAISKDGVPVNYMEQLKEDGLYNEKDGIQLEDRKLSIVAVERTLLNCAFQVNFIVKDNEGIVNMFSIQAIIAGILACAALMASFIFYLAKKKVMEPMNYFSQTVSKLKEENQDIYFEDCGVYELEQANQLFRENIEQVKQFKQKIYEQELEKQKMELEYLQLQINPHFYINCMNQIYGMSCMEDYPTIQKMSLCVSDYFRYIFQKKSDYVSLEKELEHVRNYLEICKLRFEQKLEYTIDVRDDMSDIVVPPLLLHTFVENSMEHSMTSDYLNCLNVTAERIHIEEIEFVLIEISDDGEGFAEETLAQLQSGQLEIKSNGSGVGIRNAIYRLHYLYGSRAKLNFFNRETGGAVIRLCIPLEAEKIQDKER